MSASKIAVPTGLYSRSLKSAIPLVAQSGANGIQLDILNETKDLTSHTSQRHFLKLLGQHNLALGNTYLPLRHPLDDQEFLEPQVAMFQKALRDTAMLKSDVLTTCIGTPPEKESKEFPVLVEVMNDLAREAEHLGVTISLLPLHQSPVELREFFKNITQGHLTLNFDPAVIYTSGYSPADEYQAVYEDVSHVVVRDSIRNLDGSGQEVPFGEGNVPWDELFALLYEGRFPGWMTAVRSRGSSIQADLEKTIQAIQLKTMNFWQ